MSAVSKNACFARCDVAPVGARPRARVLARPHEDPHAERPAVLRDDPADPAVAEDSERLAAYRVPDRGLPLAGLQGRYLLGNLSHRGEHEAPGQLGRGERGRTGMQVRRDDDAEPGAGVDVDVRIGAALADQAERRQPLEERRPDRGALADEHEGLAVAQPLGQGVHVLDVVVPDRDLMAVELREARERAQRVDVVVEDRDLHRDEVEHAGPLAAPATYVSHVFAVSADVVAPALFAALPRGWHTWYFGLTDDGTQATTLASNFRIRRDDPLGWSHQIRRGPGRDLGRDCGDRAPVAASPSEPRVRLPLRLVHAQHARQESSPLAEDRFEGGIGCGYDLDLRVDYGEAQPSRAARNEVQVVLDRLRFPHRPDQCERPDHAARRAGSRNSSTSESSRSQRAGPQTSSISARPPSESRCQSRSSVASRAIAEAIAGASSATSMPAPWSGEPFGRDARAHDGDSGRQRLSDLALEPCAEPQRRDREPPARQLVLDHG